MLSRSSNLSGPRRKIFYKSIDFFLRENTQKKFWSRRQGNPILGGRDEWPFDVKILSRWKPAHRIFIVTHSIIKIITIICLLLCLILPRSWTNVARALVSGWLCACMEMRRPPDEAHFRQGLITGTSKASIVNNCNQESSKTMAKEWNLMWVAAPL